MPFKELVLKIRAGRRYLFRNRRAPLFWNRFFFLIELVLVLPAVWWIPYPHVPVPGLAVALISVAAAAMSVHVDMKDWQKILWLTVIAFFPVDELRAIRKDRFDSQQQAIADRAAQEASFAVIRTQQQAAFTATTKGLATTISGIGSTLRTANTTLLQTQPRAALIFEGFNLHEASQVSRPLNMPHDFDYRFVNRGTETARHVEILAKAYAGLQDDKEVQIGLARAFDDAWKSGMRTSSVDALVPDFPSFNTLSRSFSEQEIQGRTIKAPSTI